MKTVFVLFDSLNRKAMECYGGSLAKTPNFARFAERAVTFDTHYVGSLPCMPARRDLHTGRLGMLHRNWGPLEPFDNSFPELMKKKGIYSHLITDHHHYFADGGATYHTRYSSWELVRGNGADHWKAVVDPDLARYRRDYHPKQVRPYLTQYMVNHDHIREEKDFSCPQVFNHGIDFLKANHAADNWFLQIESFDPHEPFFAPERFRAPYPSGYQGPIFDWPLYDRVDETPEAIAEVKANYAALVAMCDEYFGRLLDTFDEYDLWADTALVVSTDHGFLLGEHDWWGKNVMPVFDELARIPLMVYHPAHRERGGERRESLTQTADLMPTFLEMHDLPVPTEVTGVSLLPLLAEEMHLHDAVIYGYFGAACNITDGRYTWFCYPETMSAEGVYEYTLMPTRIHQRFPLEQLAGMSLHPPFDFTKGISTLRVRPNVTTSGEPAVLEGRSHLDTVSVLYDTSLDPGQSTPITDAAVEARLARSMAEIFGRLDAPTEMFARYGIESGGRNFTAEGNANGLAGRWGMGEP